MFTQMQEQKPPRRRRASGNALVVVLCVVLGVAVLAAGAWLVLNRLPATSNLMKRTFYAPEKYSAYVLESSIDRFSTAAAETYAGSITQHPFPEHVRSSSTLSVSLGAGARTLLEESLEVPLDWLSSVELASSAEYAGNRLGVTLTAGLNGAELISAESVTDFSTLTESLRTEVLTPLWLETDFSEYLDDAAAAQLEEMTGGYSGILNALPDRDTMEALLDRYLSLMAAHLTDVTKEQGTLTAAGVSSGCTVLTYTITEERLEGMLRELYTALAEDETVLDILKNVLGAAGADTAEADSFPEEMREAADNVEEDISLENDWILTLWINGLGHVSGCRLAMDGDDAMTFAFPLNGTELGLEIGAVEGEDSFSLTGSGKLDGGSVTGTFVLAAEGEDYLRMELRDLDVLSAVQGEYKGSFALSPTRAFWDDLLGDISMARMLEAYSLEVRWEGSLSSCSAEARILQNSAAFASLSLRFSRSDGTGVPVPDSGVTPEEWLEDTIDGGGLQVFAQSLYDTDIPEEYVDSLVAYAGLLALYYR